MIKYWKFIFIQILHSSIIVYALLEESTKYPGRKFSTAHSFPNNNTVYILGGLTLPQNRFESWNIFDLNQTDYSLHLNNNNTNLSHLPPPTIGHTSHLHVPSNTIISVFGMQPNQTESPPLIPYSSFQQKRNNNSLFPTSRYKHSSILINNELLYVIGGEKVKEKKLIESQDIIWNYSFSTNTWKRLDHQQHPAMAGHISLVYNQWIISCFGYQQDISLLHNNSCTWFDTNTFRSTSPTITSNTSPSSRKFSNLVSIGNDTHILYGGENGKEILSDLWKLHVNDTFKMTWERINTTTTNHKRSGHASTLLSNQNIILYYGGQQQQETDPIYLNLSNMAWIQPDNHHLTRISRTDVIEDSNTNSSISKLNGGIIAAIIIGILVIFGLLIAFFIWKKRFSRQQSIHQQSRAARFSHSPAPMQNVQEDYNSSSLPLPNLVSLPELALSRHSNKSHTSVNSLNPNSQQQQQASPPPEIIEEQQQQQQQQQPNRDYKRRESTGFKRLTLNLFSSQQQQDEPAPAPPGPKKSSNIFQLRSSKLLLQATANNSMNNSRISVGAKSVSSVQWVGFNDNMDYKGNHWRDSSNSSMHLAVTNAQRASSYYTNESTTSTPKSPLFASHLRDSSAIHYQFSDQSDTSSWRSDQIIDRSSSNITSSNITTT